MLHSVVPDSHNIWPQRSNLHMFLVQLRHTVLLVRAQQGDAWATGTQAALIDDIAITYSSNDPSITPDGAVTVSNGSTPTVAELLELAEEIIANQNAIIDALQAFGIVATE